MSDALISAPLRGLQSQQPAAALLCLVSHSASGDFEDPQLADLRRGVIERLRARGELSTEFALAGATWADIAKRHQTSAAILQALNGGAASPQEGQQVCIAAGEFCATISRAKRVLRITWQDELAAEFSLFGLETVTPPTGPQEIRQKRIDSIYYDPKISHQPREAHGLRFDRHILQLASGVKIHGVPDWDANTMGLGLSASDAAIAYAALSIGSRVEWEAESGLARRGVKKLRAEFVSHVAEVRLDSTGWRPVRVTAANIGSIGQSPSSACTGGHHFALIDHAGPKNIPAFANIEVSSALDDEDSWTSSFTTAELGAISWPIEASPAPLPPASESGRFPLAEQGAAWPPPTGWQLLQLGLTLTAVVLLGLFVMRQNPEDSPLVKNRPAPVTRPGPLPKPIADTAQATPKTPANPAPAPLTITHRPAPATNSPITSPATPRVERAVFEEKPGADGLPPIVSADQIPRVTMEVLVPNQAVAVGARAIYEIRLKNQSATPVEGIDVGAFFSEGFEPDAADGAPARHGPGRLQFDRLGRINPGESIVLRVAAKAQSPGAHRFRPEVSIVNPPQRLHSEVTTRFYAPISSGPPGGMNR